MRNVLGALAGAMLLATAANAAPDHGAIHVKNKSDWEIRHFFLSPLDHQHWGPDQLDHLVALGGAFDLHQVACDTYDVKLVDGDGDECEITAVDLCAEPEGWVITNDDLLNCEGGAGD